MTWNYRIVKAKSDGSKTGEIFYIKEAYYENKQDPHSLTVNPIYAQGDTLEELKEDFRLMNEAFQKPVLKEEKYDN